MAVSDKDRDRDRLMQTETHRQTEREIGKTEKSDRLFILIMQTAGARLRILTRTSKKYDVHHANCTSVPIRVQVPQTFSPPETEMSSDK